MDGEADDLELRRLLKSLKGNPELAHCWERYHLAQSVLHDRGIPVSDQLANRVAVALDSEPGLDASSPGMQWRQGLMRVAIAACVALITAVILMPTEQSTTEIPSLAQEAGSEIPANTADESDDGVISSGNNAPADTLLAESPVIEVDPDAQQRLQEYIEAMRFDPEEPVRVEHIQDSPLFRLVNDYQTRP